MYCEYRPICINGMQSLVVFSSIQRSLSKGGYSEVSTAIFYYRLLVILSI